LHNHCFLLKREAQKPAFAHFNNLKQNFRWRPQFTDQRQQISHLFAMASIQMGVTAGILLASILLKEMRYLVYIRYLWAGCMSLHHLKKLTSW
jgi:hypothetical protein